MRRGRPHHRNSIAEITDMAGAACESSTLPWTDEGRPGPSDMNRMRSLCCGCRVQPQCAHLALQIGATGTWAGIWIGAKGPARANARRALRALFGGAA